MAVATQLEVPPDQPLGGDDSPWRVSRMSTAERTRPRMFQADRIHKILIALFGMVLVLSIWAILSQFTDPRRLPLAVWTALGAVSATGAILEIWSHLRTRSSLKSIRSQLKKMSDEVQVGMVMVEDDWTVVGLPHILNGYLTVLRGQLEEQAREQRELDLLVSAMNAEKHNTEAIIKSISDAVLVLNAFGELILANPPAESLFRFDLRSVREQLLEELTGEQALCRLVHDAQGQDKPSGPSELRIRDGNDEDRCFEVTVSPVHSKDGMLWATAIILHDVTRERELAELKNEFVSYVSHELKAPMTAIKAHAELLLDGEIDSEAEQAEFHRVILSESHRLERFINNILNLQRIESDLMPFNPGCVLLSNELPELAALMRPQAEDKEIELRCEVAAVEIEADRELLRQAVLNLLSNAIKYTPVGGVVTVQAHEDYDRGCCIIEVSDTGVGISGHDRERIFEKFYRTESGSRVAGGTGIGLALVKEIVEDLHGGTLTVDSSPAGGSTFTITLWRDKVQTEHSDRELTTVGAEGS